MSLHVLVPHDLGPAADAAFQWAVRLVRAEGGRVHVFHAVPLVPMALTGPGGVVAALDGADVDALQAEVAARVRTNDVACEVEVTIVADPGEAIVLIAQRTKCDLVVMGTHGRHPIARAVVGSVADYVIRHAPCPVLTVRQS